MNTPHEDDARFQELIGSTPMTQEAPLELRSKLQAMAAAATIRRASLWPRRLALAGIAGVALAVVAFSLMPAKALAKTYDRVLSATQNQKAFQLVIESDEKDKHLVIGAIDGRFVLKGDNGSLMQIDGKSMQIYNPEENTVTELSLGGLVDPKMIASEINKGLSEGFKEMDLHKMLHDYEVQYGRENIHIGPIVHRSGQSVYEVSLQKPGETERVNMTVDADTDLPTRIEVDKQEGDSWNRDTVIQLRFDGAVDQDLLRLEFPASAKRVKLDLGKMISSGIKGIDFDRSKGD